MIKSWTFYSDETFLLNWFWLSMLHISTLVQSSLDQIVLGSVLDLVWLSFGFFRLGLSFWSLWAIWIDEPPCKYKVHLHSISFLPRDSDVLDDIYSFWISSKLPLYHGAASIPTLPPCCYHHWAGTKMAVECCWCTSPLISLLYIVKPVLHPWLWATGKSTRMPNLSVLNQILARHQRTTWSKRNIVWPFNWSRCGGFPFLSLTVAVQQQ